MCIKLSSHFKNLVSAMLDKDPANRPSLIEILNNAWLKKFENLPAAQETE